MVLKDNTNETKPVTETTKSETETTEQNNSEKTNENETNKTNDKDGEGNLTKSKDSATEDQSNNKKKMTKTQSWSGHIKKPNIYLNYVRHLS